MGFIIRTKVPSSLSCGLYALQGGHLEAGGCPLQRYEKVLGLAKKYIVKNILNRHDCKVL